MAQFRTIYPCREPLCARLARSVVLVATGSSMISVRRGDDPCSYKQLWSRKQQPTATLLRPFLPVLVLGHSTVSGGILAEATTEYPH